MKKAMLKVTPSQAGENMPAQKAIAKPATSRFDPALITKLKSIIARYTDRPDLLDGVEQLSDETDISFIKLLNIDSVDVVEIVVDIEDHFGIVIQDEELKAFKSFGDMYNLIEQKLSDLKNNQ